MQNKKLRLLRMGLETALGLRRQGFFAPYRYAATVPPPGPYPELERVFAGAWPFRLRDARAADTLGQIEGTVERIAGVDGPPPEPRWGQSWFPRLDAAAAYAIVLGSGARRIVEVGSGHSTRFLARAARDLRAPGGSGPPIMDGPRPERIRITCIDPEPRASLDGLDIDWRREMLEPQHLDLFRALRAGDIAFFDSSHLLWPGTDVDLILNRILPSLRPGVFVHVHDVFLPDPYPADWAWRGYTEQLGLAGYLTSPGWQIVWASHYAVTRMAVAERPAIAALPMPDGARESSLWLVRRD